MDPVRRGLGLAALGQVGVLAVLLAAGAAGPLGIAAGAAYGLLCDVLLRAGLARSGARRVGAANAVTWARCGVVGAVVALAVAPTRGGSWGALVVAAVIALLLDGVDGRVARATGTASELGARFDMEVDASLVLALSVGAAARVGAWILLAGAARYLLLAAAVLLPRLAGPTPPTLWRKVVAVALTVVLLVVCAGVLAPPIAEGVAALAALALAVSFGTQIHGLLGASPGATSTAPETVDARAR